MTEKSPLTFLLSAGAAPQFKVIRWTPEMAEYAFKNHNTHQHQRSFNRDTADKYRRTMEAGNWRAAWPQCVIAFSVGGVLLNGQKTLWAIWKSGITIEVCTQWNVPESDFLLYDDFQSRNLAQLSRQAGLTNVHARTSLTRMIMCLEQGEGMNVAPSVADVQRLTVDDEVANVVLNHVQNHRGTDQIGNYCACQYALWKIAKINGVEVALKFYDTMVAGVNLNEVDPRLHLGRFLRARRGHSDRASRYLTAVGFIKAFNAWANNKPMGLLRVINTEEMPVVVKAFFHRIL